MSIQYSAKDTEQVNTIIEKLITWFPGKFKDINKDHIQVVFRDSLKSPWRANIKLLTGLNSAFTQKKIALIVWKGNFEGSDEYQRALALYEQLIRVQYDDNKKKYVLRKHDVQTFLELLQEFGLNSEKFKEVLDKVASK